MALEEEEPAWDLVLFRLQTVPRDLLRLFPEVYFKKKMVYIDIEFEL